LGWAVGSRLARRAALSFVSVSASVSGSVVVFDFVGAPSAAVAVFFAVFVVAVIVGVFIFAGAEAQRWRSSITIVVAASRADILRFEWLLLAFAFGSSISGSNSMTSSFESRCRTKYSLSVAGSLKDAVLDGLWAMIWALLLHDMTAARRSLIMRVVAFAAC
jgi:hypothetical protein